ncbi:MAG: hypothetical protein WC641_01225 [Patescibacteria group bacterium]
MNEKPFGGEAAVSDVETKKVKIKKLGEGASTGWEGERTFTAEEVITAIRELDAKAGDVEVTDQLISHEGVLLSMSVRTPGSASGYSFMLKGNHGASFRSRTVIESIDYAGPSSESVTFAQEIAEYKNGAWVK